MGIVGTIHVKPKRCKSRMEVMEFGVLTDEYRCVLEPGHKGNHVSENKHHHTVTWANLDDIRSRVENEYKGL